MFLRLDTKQGTSNVFCRSLKRTFFLTDYFPDKQWFVCMKQALEQRVLYSCCLVAFIPVAWLLLSATKD
jgi:hypothetical protein